ncbi:ATP-binding protein [Nocardiopsis sp. TSRI0078]|uniref:sensor histidine kinase n=1 Tax=unclassified Nocardiopsis TaxID=2649073 RepID=UPI00093C67EE|nr:ATP-binding protein [Nocardiopsis sp. TSRI0078]OKI15695.1 ATP-binding protein [Nocardiopsis sp. TSRI0078]
MSVHASGSTRHGPRPGQQALVALLLVTALAAPAWSWAVITAPADARQSVALFAGTAGIALCAAVAVAAHQAAVARAARDHGTRADTTAETLERETAHLVDRILPALAEGVREGVPAREVLARHPQPSHAWLHRLAHAVGAELDAVEARAAHDRARRADLEDQVADLDRSGLALMVTRVREDRLGAAEALQGELPPVDDALARLRRHVLEELLASARRSAAAMEAASASGARVQAHLTALLARLRELQDRYGDAPGIFGDLLDIDHGVSRTGRLADGFVILAGGRSGRRWTRPIVMESILRGAMGRISAYRRVRLHNTSTAAIAGYAAEGVMQALAELMDNAANFSAHGTEVHVYVQEEDTGLTITVEDGGLGMRVRERRLAESLVTHPRDLSTLRGTRMGLAIVGRLADKYGLSVSFRPSAHGGVGVVVLVPPHLVTDSRPAPAGPGAARHSGRHPRHTGQRPRDAEDAVHGPAVDADPAAPARLASGLPRRRRGQTLAAALREEPRQLSQQPAHRPGTGDPGTRFAAFRDAGGTGGAPSGAR